MAIRFKDKDGGKVLEVHVSGKLAHEDYLPFAPKFEQLIKQHGKLRVFFDMTDFHGWEGGVFWDDIKFDIKHFSDIERIAMVGDKEWEKQMSLFCRPFTTAEIRYFDKINAPEAWAWLEGDLGSR